MKYYFHGIKANVKPEYMLYLEQGNLGTYKIVEGLRIPIVYRIQSRRFLPLSNNILAFISLLYNFYEDSW